MTRIPKFNWALILLIVVAFPTRVFSQLVVDSQISIEEAITKLVGSGVKVTNIRVDCPSGKSRPYGYFVDNTGTLGMTDGLVITTGAAKNAVGPNNSASLSQDNKNENQDPDLASIVQGSEKQYDACIIEFDVEVFADTLTFDYVFGSEEYLEFIKDYHDVFGFFISGPGITGKRNLAVLPGTQQTISVSNVNNRLNSQYYVDNGTGSTPFDNLFVQYDGFTKRLESKIAVVPCSKYSLKLAICDIKDAIYDAGIFIAGKSLKTKAPNIQVRYEFPKFPSAIEGCNGAFVKIVRQSRIKEGITFQLRYSGTATPDIDFGAVPDSLVFFPGESEKEFYIPVYPDALKEGEELIKIELLNPCPGLPQVDSKNVIIRESFEFDIPDSKMCEGDSLRLNTNPAEGYDYSWSPAQYLSCVLCPQPVAYPPSTQKWYVTVQDPLSECHAEDSLMVSVDPKPIAGFSFTGKPDYTSLDVFFQNQSSNADTWVWSFGDGTTSNLSDPSHFYQAGFNTDSIDFPIVLTAKNSLLGCEDSASARVRIGNPLFIPNLISPNGDELNDGFQIRGIRPSIWNLDVFDRWGKNVFTTSAYDLNWKGESLVSGVYFYVLENPDGIRRFSGWIEIVR